MWKHNHCFLILLSDLHVTVNNTNVFNVAMKMQQWVKSALLSSYKIFVVAFNNIDVRRSSRKVADNLTTPGVSGRTCMSPIPYFKKLLLVDIHDKANRSFSDF